MADSRTLNHPQEWDLTLEQALRLQEELRSQVVQQPLALEKVRRVAGVDASFQQGKVIGAAIVLDAASLQPVDQAFAERSVSFPYIPGLLSFRETPVLLAAFEKLSSPPQVVIVDGHGLAHPRRFGIACHLGVLLDLPTIGLAKSVLVGQVAFLDERAGSTAELKEGDEIIGMAVRTRAGSKPIYVSIGHRVDLPSSVRLVLNCGRGYRLPEPARLAHQLATQAKREIHR